MYKGAYILFMYRCLSISNINFLCPKLYYFSEFLWLFSVRVCDLRWGPSRRYLKGAKSMTSGRPFSLGRELMPAWGQRVLGVEQERSTKRVEVQLEPRISPILRY